MVLLVYMAVMVNSRASALKQVFVIEFEAAITCSKALQSGLTSHHDLLPRATEEALAMFVGLSFKNRQNENKSLEGG
jgi:hypothetical protein